MTGKPLLSRAEVLESRRLRKAQQSRKPVKKRNAKRKGQRYPERREPKYLAWLRAQPCVISGIQTGDIREQGHGIAVPFPSRFTVVAAHNPSRGAGGYDRDALPLETRLHDEQHRIGIKTFCAKYNLDWKAEVVKHRARYAGLSQTGPGGA